MTVTRHQAVGAYQPWQPPSFDSGAEPPRGAPDDKAPAKGSATAADKRNESTNAAPPDFRLPTADEIEQIYEQAHREGHEAGFAEGRTEGYEEGKALGRAEAERLAELVAALEASFTALDQEVAQEIVTLAIAVARQIVGHAVTADSTAVLHVVREALLQLPQNKVRIHINPEDAAGIREHLGEQLEQGHHHLLEDEAIERGGCRLESAGCEVDATMETRWRRVVEGMGRDPSPWTADE